MFFPRTESGHSIIEQIVKRLLFGVLAVLLTLRFGPHHPGLKIVTEIRLFLVFDRIIDPLPAFVRGKGIIKAAATAGFQVSQTGRTMIQACRLAGNPGVFSTIPAIQTHDKAFLFSRNDSSAVLGQHLYILCQEATSVKWLARRQ
jgi:hypothetical protein